MNRLSRELFVEYQYNNNLGLNKRGLAGAGVRYLLVEEGAIRATFSTGFMSETERWKPVEGEMIENTFLKSTSNLALRGQITEDASLLVIGYYQARRSEEHTSELQSRGHLVCRLLLEKQNTILNM